MKEGNEPTRRLPERPPGKERPSQPEGRVGLRGCWELIIKLIIALIVIGAFIAYWLSRRELNPLALILLLILVALLVWLILRQKHFVFLNCNLTKPTDCVHGNPKLLADHVLEPIVGTASGIGFSHYELEVLWNGVIIIPAGVIYADNAGNPDTTLATGNHQVNNGTLGFVDIQQAVLGAGANILTSTSFEVRLHVIGIDGSRQTCTITFSITAARAYIKTIGGALANDVTNPDEPLRRADDGTLATVGGGISVRGAATPYGCGSEKIAEYSLWVKDDPTFTIAQPPNGAPYDPLANGWSNITTVTYTNDDQRNYNTLDGMPDPNFLTNQSVWSTRIVCSWVDLLPPICFTVPDLAEFWWDSKAKVGSGKYTFLLKMIDTAGNTYYDIQRAWIDNKDIKGKIQGPAGIAACQDIYILDVPGGILEIKGYATDPLIVPTDPATAPTNDNFKSYSVGFRKQGAADDFWLAIPLAGGGHPGLSPTIPVPTRAVWKGAAADPADPPVDVLAEWKLDWLTGGNPAVPADQRLAPGESCTYDIVLEAWDKTIVNEDYLHLRWTGRLTFPVKIHNAHA